MAQPSYRAFFLTAAVALFTVVGVVVFAVIVLQRPLPNPWGAASGLARDKNVCTTRGGGGARQTCEIATGSLWGYCNNMPPAACATSNLCGVAPNGRCVIAGPHSDDVGALCNSASPKDCSSVVYPSCCQCDCTHCSDLAGCNTGGIAAGCAEAVTPDQCRAAGASCRWFC